MDLDTLMDDFSLFDDWREKYQYLIDLGRDLSPLAPDLKIDDNLVRGCQSQVWLILRPNTEDRSLQIQADSDSAIVKGLCAIIIAVYAGLSPEDLGGVDIDAIFEEIGLDQHLSPNRRNGFYSMVQRIQAFAA